MIHDINNCAIFSSRKVQMYIFSITSFLSLLAAIFIDGEMETGHCQLTQHGSVIISINDTIFNLSNVQGFCVCNGTGIHLDKIICFEKPDLVPRCGSRHKNSSWCVEERMPSYLKVIAFTGEYFMVEVINVTAFHISHFYTMLEVDGVHNFRELVCALYLNHTVKGMSTG